MSYPDDLLPVPIESAWQISPLRRCLEALKFAREIGVPDAMWLAERAVKSYMQSAGPNYTDKRISLEALKSSWSQYGNTRDADLISGLITKFERDLRQTAERLLQEIDTPSSSATTVPSDHSDRSPRRGLWGWPFRGNAPD
jgi:hypothetical protein